MKKCPEKRSKIQTKCAYAPCKRDQIKMRNYMDRRVTLPTWGPQQGREKLIGSSKVFSLLLEQTNKS